MAYDLGIPGKSPSGAAMGRRAFALRRPYTPVCSGCAYQVFLEDPRVVSKLENAGLQAQTWHDEGRYV